MEQRTLGRTRLEVSQLGLGCGGNSRLGMSTGGSIPHAADVVRAAFDMGITLVDTARVYGTEPAVGLALKGRRRGGVVVSSKSPYLDQGGQLLTPADFQAHLDDSLRDLGLDWIDIYFIHGLRLPHYEACRDRFLPVLERARQAGKVRFIGLTEAFETDTGHAMLPRALQDPDWDVVMVGFNLLNQTARQRVFDLARVQSVGTLDMFAVRRSLIDPTWLRILLERIAAAGEIDPALAQAPDLMEALKLTGVCQNLSEAAYRFCAYEPGMDVVLSGTGSPVHLRQNIEAVQHGALPQEVVEHLARLFARVEGFSGQVHPDQ